MYIQRVATVYDPDVDAFPPEFREVLTEQDVEAIRTGPAYFATLAGAGAPLPVESNGRRSGVAGVILSDRARVRLRCRAALACVRATGRPRPRDLIPYRQRACG